jgi:hypothetical protein
VSQSITLECLVWYQRSYDSCSALAHQLGAVVLVLSLPTHHSSPSLRETRLPYFIIHVSSLCQLLHTNETQ